MTQIMAASETKHLNYIYSHEDVWYSPTHLFGQCGSSMLRDDPSNGCIGVTRYMVDLYGSFKWQACCIHHFGLTINSSQNVHNMHKKFEIYICRNLFINEI